MNNRKLSEIPPHELEDLLMNYIQESERIGCEWAVHDAKERWLDNSKHSILSDAMSGEGSNAAQEVEARKSQSYKDHLEKLRIARQDANISKVKYEAAKSKADAIRSSLATRRETLKRGI